MKNSEYRLFYKESVNKDLKKIDAKERERIVEKIETQLIHSPYKGKQLKEEFKGLRSLRVGDYRVIYKIIQKDVIILAVGHRKDIYES